MSEKHVTLEEFLPEEIQSCFKFMEPGLVEMYNKSKSLKRYKTKKEGSLLFSKYSLISSSFRDDVYVNAESVSQFGELFLIEGKYFLSSEILFFNDEKYLKLKVLLEDIKIEKCFLTGNYFFSSDMVDIITDQGLQRISNSCEAPIKSKLFEVYFSTDKVAEKNGFFYSLEFGDWIKKEKNVNSSYHSKERKVLPSKSGFRVGFEIEKEDEDIKLKYFPESLNKLTNWHKENDASLGTGGFELISPAFDLYDDDQIFSHFNILEKLINAKYSASCGGHINVSKEGLDSKKLWEGLSGFLPLLYSLYKKRTECSYSKAVSKNSVGSNSSGKNVAINLKTATNIVEFRIFPAVKNVDNLKWRLGLLRIMCNNLKCNEKNVIQMILSKNSPLYKHLNLVLTDERIIKLPSEFVKYADMYNNVKIQEELVFVD